MKSISLKSLVLFILRGSYVEAVVNYQLDVKGYENTDDDSDIDAVSCYCQMHFSIDNPVATLYHQNNHPCHNLLQNSFLFLQNSAFKHLISCSLFIFLCR